MSDAVLWIPPLGAAAAIGLSSLALAAAIWCAARTRGGSGPFLFRAVGLSIVGLLLLGPSMFQDESGSALRPRIALLVDRSLSMCVSDELVNSEPASRLDALRAHWITAPTLESLNARAAVALFGLDERLEPATLMQLRSAAPTGAQTRLARVVAATLASANGAARSGDSPASDLTDIVLLTDGVDTDDPTDSTLIALAGRAQAAGVRIHAVVPGSVDRPPDVALQLTCDTPIVSEGQSATLRVRLWQTGFTGRRATLRVREREPGSAVSVGGDYSMNSDREVLRRALTLGAPAEIEIPVHPRHDPAHAEGVAMIEYVASIEPLEGESDTANNARRTYVQVADKRIRVALFENQPHWDSKFFIAAMRADPQVELTSITGLGEGRERIVRTEPGVVTGVETTLPAAPLSEKDLFAFDVIVLGRGVERWFGGDRAALLQRYVAERGGSLVFLRGPATDSNTPEGQALRKAIQDIAPVNWSQGVLAGARLVPTEEGSREPLLDFSAAESGTLGAFSALPRMIASARVDREKGLSVVWLRQVADDTATIANAPARDALGQAAVAHMSVGHGRTLGVLAEGLWRWAFLPASRREQTSVYRVFWGRAIRWLALGGEFLPGQSISLSVDKPTPLPGDTVSIAVRTKYFEQSPPRMTLRIREPDGAVREAALTHADLAGNQSLATFTPTKEGVHEVELLAFADAAAADAPTERITTRFEAREARAELLDTAARRDELRTLAERTGGTLLSIDHPEELLDRLAAELKLSKSGAKPTPAWDRLWVFTIIISALGIEWIWRRRKGLA